MDDKTLVSLSRRLSRHLRHEPGAIGIELGPGGWTGVDALPAALACHGRGLSRAELAEVLARNDKQRFAFDEAGRRIRANQGHNVPSILAWPWCHPRRSSITAPSRGSCRRSGRRDRCR
jgi:putative RNA 2'-phosphotransferase